MWAVGNEKKNTRATRVRTKPDDSKLSTVQRDKIRNPGWSFCFCGWVSKKQHLPAAKPQKSFLTLGGSSAMVRFDTNRDGIRAETIGASKQASTLCAMTLNGPGSWWSSRFGTFAERDPMPSTENGRMSQKTSQLELDRGGGPICTSASTYKY